MKSIMIYVHDGGRTSIKSFMYILLKNIVVSDKYCVIKKNFSTARPFATLDLFAGEYFEYYIFSFVLGNDR